MTNHDLAMSRARVKLWKRHLLEWTALSDNQQLVWKLARAEFTRKLSLCENDDVARFQMNTQHAQQFSRILTDHREKREELKVSHQYDFFLLNQLEGNIAD